MKLKPLISALLAAGLLISGAANAFDMNSTDSIQNKSAIDAAILPGNAPNYREIVERYAPAVVGINTEGIEKTSSKGMDQGSSDDPVFRFFRGMPGIGNQTPRADVPTRGLASGFIIAKDGLILTNAHVVRDTDEVIVKLSDRREFKAKVLGSDNATDIAVLKINAENLPVVNLGNSNHLNVGDYVLAIGSPFGFEHSATAGIVSAKGRSLPGDGYVPFIQTDAAVNPGNSGGPLFDASGEVVGITSQIYSQTGGYQGLSFAIPIDVALRVKDQIVATGKVVHARLGVTVQEVNQSLAESFKLKQPEGTLVSDVTNGSAAQRAGIESGDVILKYNGHAIADVGDLPSLVEMAKPGDKAVLEIWRAGKKIELTAILGQAKDAVVADAATGASHGKLGVAVHVLTPDEKSESKLNSGLVVDEASGPAARAGIEAGDVIVAVNGTPVKSVDQLRQIVDQQSTRVAVLIQRGDARIFIPVKLG